MEILNQDFQAQHIFTEMEIDYYCSNWKKCDFVTQIQDENVGVSVTRVLPPPPPNNPKSKKCRPAKTNEVYVAELLHKKLFGLVVSRAGTLDKCIFSRSILFAWTPNREISQLLKATFDYCADESLKEDIELVIVEASEAELRNDFFQPGDIEYIRV